MTALDGDKDTAKRVAERVKEHVGSTGGERADFITFVDQCIAEMVETQSLSDGGLPTRSPTRDGRCGEKKEHDDEKIMLLQLQRPHSKPSSRSISGGKGALF